MTDTYKAVFVCEALGERVVWYVSSRREADKHVRAHITTPNGTYLKRYKANEWSVTVTAMFGDHCEVHYDVVGSWGN